MLTRAVELSQWVEPFFLTSGDVVNSDNIELGLAYSWRNAIIDKNSIHLEFFEQFKLYSSFLSNVQLFDIVPKLLLIIITILVDFYNPKSALYCYKKVDVENSFDTSVSATIMFLKVSRIKYLIAQNILAIARYSNVFVRIFPRAESYWSSHNCNTNYVFISYYS